MPFAREQNVTIPCQYLRLRFYSASAILLLTLCALLAGCGREREDDLLIPDDEPPVTISYVAPNAATLVGPEQVAIERFQQRAPSIEIDRQSYRRDGADYLLDDPPPDVMLVWDGYLLRSAAEQGLLADLSDIWSENNLAEHYGRRFRDISRFDGALRFVPAGFNWSGIFYNKEIFARYGLTPPATWEEFVRICDMLLANGETPMSLSGQNPFISSLWFDYLNMRMNGPEFHRDLVAGRVNYSDERVARVWELWISLLDRGYFNETPSSTTDLGSMTALVRGDAENSLNSQKAVMALAPQFSVGELPALFANELDFFQFPQMDPWLPVGEVSIVFGYVIPAGALNRLEAGVFVGYMGSAEAQELQLRQVGEDESNVGYVAVHQEFERDLLSAAAEKGEHIVRGADEIGPPLILGLPDSMQRGFNQVLRRLFLKSGTPITVAEIQTILEEARQRAIRNGEYSP